MHKLNICFLVLFVVISQDQKLPKIHLFQAEKVLNSQNMMVSIPVPIIAGYVRPGARLYHLAVAADKVIISQVKGLKKKNILRNGNLTSFVGPNFMEYKKTCFD